MKNRYHFAFYRLKNCKIKGMTDKKSYKNTSLTFNNITCIDSLRKSHQNILKIVFVNTLSNFSTKQFQLEYTDR